MAHLPFRLQGPAAFFTPSKYLDTLVRRACRYCAACQLYGHISGTEEAIPMSHASCIALSLPRAASAVPSGR